MSQQILSPQSSRYKKNWWKKNYFSESLFGPAIILCNTARQLFWTKKLVLGGMKIFFYSVYLPKIYKTRPSPKFIFFEYGLYIPHIILNVLHFTESWMNQGIYSGRPLWWLLSGISEYVAAFLHIKYNRNPADIFFVA